MTRGFWFVAGAGAGIYVMVKVRRAAEVLTPEGFRDRMSGLNLGAHLFADEVRAGMAERESELRERLEWTLDGPRELTPSRPRGVGTIVPPSSTPEQENS